MNHASPNVALEPPFQGLHLCAGWYPGRCPGLWLNCPFGAGDIMATEAWDITPTVSWDIAVTATILYANCPSQPPVPRFVLNANIASQLPVQRSVFSANIASQSPEPHPVLSANGAPQPEPRATPWVWQPQQPKALKGRSNPCHNPLSGWISTWLSAQDVALEPPFQGLRLCAGWYPGRCPGLWLNCPFGAGDIMATEAGDITPTVSWDIAVTATILYANCPSQPPVPRFVLNANIASQSPGQHPVLSANGAPQPEPRATPWVWQPQQPKALKGRSNPCHNPLPGWISTWCSAPKTVSPCCETLSANPFIDTWQRFSKTLGVPPLSSTRPTTTSTSSLTSVERLPSAKRSRRLKRRPQNGSKHKALNTHHFPGSRDTGPLPSRFPIVMSFGNTLRINPNIIAKDPSRKNTGHFSNAIKSPLMNATCGIDLVQDELVWLTQKLMGELFGVDVRTISEHFCNLFECRELQENSVILKFRITAAGGKYSL